MLLTRHSVVPNSSLLSPDREIDHVSLPPPVQELLQGGRWDLGRPRAPVAPQHDPGLQPRPDMAQSEGPASEPFAETEAVAAFFSPALPEAPPPAPPVLIPRV